MMENKVAPKQIKQIEHSLLKQNMKQKISNEEIGQFQISESVVDHFQWYA